MIIKTSILTIFNDKVVFINRVCLVICSLIFIWGCNNNKNYKFKLLSSKKTNIDFVNKIKNTENLNIQNYGYFYDGGGVSVGDINNDGLPDIYLVGNESLNHLYLNEGNFEFKDITISAGVGGGTKGWSTGSTMADVNGDGNLDIYVCRVNYQNKRGGNQLFINNGDSTFTEEASKYGLDYKGYSTQAAFFDYDKDGDLDMYLLNHSFHSGKTTGKRAELLRNEKDSLAGDRLYKNDNNHFVDVTEFSNIYSSAIGFGLGIAISDINKDGWPDIYIGNDYQEDDYFYINNKDGTFSEGLGDMIRHTSKSSMGNDIADINNDGNMDIVSVDMLPDNEVDYKKSLGPDSYMVSELHINSGYKPQYAHNTLQLNRGIVKDKPLFSEIGFASGIGATDWSWAPLIMDLDNDGFNDIFVTNGIIGRPTDLDYNRKLNKNKGHISITKSNEGNFNLIKDMPSVKIPNYVFKNNGNLTFSNKAKEWGFGQPTYSSGLAYADLDNNGTLDIIVNNVNMPTFIYKNNTKTDTLSNFIEIKLLGNRKNTFAIGTKVILYADNKIYYQEEMPTRGFQSSVDYKLHFGIGRNKKVDSLLVIWPDDSFQKFRNISINQTFKIDQKNASNKFDYHQLQRSDQRIIKDVTDLVPLDYRHQEDSYSSFAHEPLVPFDLSRLGPAIAKGDINNDNLDDFYVGGAYGQPGKLFVQEKRGSFRSIIINDFEVDKFCEDVSAVFFDSNNDGLVDLYVVSGGDEFIRGDKKLQDRLYINQGNNRFEKAIGKLPDLYNNGSIVADADFNNDGYRDLFVGSVAVPWRYGELPNSYLLMNDGNGKFIDVTKKIAPGLQHIGMVTDAEWVKNKTSKYPKLLIAGLWMPISLFDNNGKKLFPITKDVGLDKLHGLWTNLLTDDFNGDGKFDIIAGNFGENSRLKASISNPLRLYTNDFNKSGQVVSIMATKKNGHFYPLQSLDELLLQFRSLKNNYDSYTEYANKNMSEIFSDQAENAQIKKVNTLSTVLFKSQDDNHFKVESLPSLSNISPVMAMYSGDFNNDAKKDVIILGNINGVKPSFGGRQDASYGLLLMGKGNGQFQQIIDVNKSGLFVKGEPRAIIPIKKSANDSLLLIAKNNGEMKILRY